MPSIYRYAPKRMEKGIIPDQGDIEARMMPKPQDIFKKRIIPKEEQKKADPFNYSFEKTPI